MFVDGLVVSTHTSCPFALFFFYFGTACGRVRVLACVCGRAVRNRGDNWETPYAVENDDGGLSAPLMYASVVLGMMTVWRKDRTLPANWSEGVRALLLRGHFETP